MFFIIRRKKRLFFFILINLALAVCALFLIALSRFVKGTPLSLITDCPAHLLLGIYCPLCGGTRAIDSLLRGDIISSLIYNPAVLPSIVAFMFYDILAFISILKDKDEIIKIHKAVWITIVVILILNWFVRNAVLLIFNIDYIAVLN